ncbi:Xylosyltransferase oxt [Tolypocladium ophioglossoides CBS 100239]|uniref:Xylosyltransferase oxt n=1 Tax=Tolypocladium ophioglossoides (strain CBS 100239) TaxID=1163406 RepID=A0A0L0NA51_TOLOC|nr:Xylosyltransferase oxt [Tolypocladium ophioglossoides CBS 100239]
MSRLPDRNAGALWLPSRPSGTRGRALVLAGLLLLTMAVLGSIKLIADDSVKMEEGGHDKRQFQLGGILAGHAQEAAQSLASPTGTPTTEAARLAESSNATSHATDVSTTASGALSSVNSDTSLLASTSTNDGPEATRLDDITESSHAQSSSQDILQALTDALRKIVSASSPSSWTSTTKAVGASALSGPLSDTTGTRTTSSTSSVSLPADTTPPPSDPHSSTLKQEQTPPVAKDASSSTGPQSSQSNPDFLIGLFGALADRDRKHVQVRSIAQLRVRGEPAADQSEQVFSLLSPLSGVVAQAVGIDIAAVARLIDLVLKALPVDSSAVDSAISQVAGQVSAKAVDMVPFIIPAIANALGKEVDQSTPANFTDVPGTLSNVVTHGTMVINQITSAMRAAIDPQLQAILNQVAVIVYAAANPLNLPLCAISQNVQGVTLEAVVPCSSAGKGPVSVNIITLNPEQTAVGAMPAGTAFWNIIPVASPQDYVSVESLPPADASPTQTSSMEDSAAINQEQEGAGGYGQDSLPQNPPNTPSTAARDKNGPQGSLSSPAMSQSVEVKVSTPAQLTSCPAVEHPPCPTCTSCDDCPCKECSTPYSNNGQATGPLDVASGPCPGRGFNCSECLNGWFCPPQETPAQVVPCGLGWPCFHCNSGWFCAPEDIPASTQGPPTPTTTTSLGPGSTNTAPLGNPEPKDAGTALDWGHLGCFRDAINRTLVGSKPLDYLRGDMSNSTCIEHCTSKGYSFAGTEYGKECWCGLSIRDDAVRLPESFCDTPCQGAESSCCGGSWAVSVFMCSNEANGADSGASPPGPTSPALPPAPVPAQPSFNEPPAGQATIMTPTIQPPTPAPAQPTPKSYPPPGPVAQLLLNAGINM